MRSTSTFSAMSSMGVAFAVVAAVGGCSTVSDLSPFATNIPYAQDIKPNLPQPAMVEIPAFKPAPKPPKPVEATESAPPAPPPAETAAAGAPPPEAAPASPAPAAQASASPAQAAPGPAAPAPAPAAPSVPAASAPEPPPAAAAQSPAPASPQPGNQSSAAPPAQKSAASQQAQAAPADDRPPTIPEERRAFNDDGRYPNLAQVPGRPVNQPTFTEAGQIENDLKAEAEVAKADRPASAANPAPDSTPAPQQVASAAPVPKAENGVVARLEDRSPCLSDAPAGGDPTATVHFRARTSSLTADDMASLAEALPSVREGNGAIRIFGHGDTDQGAPQGAPRFELAAARANAVAQALIGFGIPALRMAVGVACMDAADAGASVQLYAPHSS